MKKPLIKSWKIKQDDCIEYLKTLPDNSIDSLISDPPYGLAFMAKHWDKFKTAKEFQKFNKKWSKEALRVLKPGGYALVFGGSRVYHRTACGLEDAGFEIRDCIMWVYGSGFPKSQNISKMLNKQNHKKSAKEFNGFGTALKPAHEPIILARKPLSEKTVAANILKHHTGGLNIDGCRVGTSKRIPASISKNKSSKYSYSKYGLDTGKESGHNPNIGRWPANIITDGSEEVLHLFPISNSARIGNPNNPKHGKQHNKISYGWGYERQSVDHRDSGSSARFFYCAKTSSRERHLGVKLVSKQFKHGDTLRKVENKVVDKGNYHPTVKPIKLMRYLCRLITPPNGIILDPFCGSGSTGVAARLEGFRFLGIEYEKDYCKIARKRIKKNRLYGPITI